MEQELATVDMTITGVNSIAYAIFFILTFIICTDLAEVLVYSCKIYTNNLILRDRGVIAAFFYFGAGSAVAVGLWQFITYNVEKASQAAKIGHLLQERHESKFKVHKI